MDQKKIDVLERLARARVLRKKSAGYVISDEELTKAKKEGRLTGEEFSKPPLNRLSDNKQDARYNH